MLLKVATNSSVHRDILDLVDIFQENPVDISDHNVTISEETYGCITVIT